VSARGWGWWGEGGFDLALPDFVGGFWLTNALGCGRGLAGVGKLPTQKKP